MEQGFHGRRALGQTWVLFWSYAYGAKFSLSLMPEDHVWFALSDAPGYIGLHER